MYAKVRVRKVTRVHEKFSTDADLHVNYSDLAKCLTSREVVSCTL